VHRLFDAVAPLPRVLRVVRMHRIVERAVVACLLLPTTDLHARQHGGVRSGRTARLPVAPAHASSPHPTTTLRAMVACSHAAVNELRS